MAQDMNRPISGLMRVTPTPFIAQLIRPCALLTATLAVVHLPSRRSCPPKAVEPSPGGRS